MAKKADAEGMGFVTGFVTGPKRSKLAELTFADGRKKTVLKLVKTTRQTCWFYASPIAAGEYTVKAKDVSAGVVMTATSRTRVAAGTVSVLPDIDLYSAPMRPQLIYGTVSTGCGVGKGTVTFAKTGGGNSYAPFSPNYSINLPDGQYTATAKDNNNHSSTPRSLTVPGATNPVNFSCA